MTQAPLFSARPLDGGAGSAPIALASLLARGPVVLAFFKITCPTCQLAFPFLERLHAQGTGLRFVGVSQDDAGLTRQFAQKYGVTFPILLDPANDRYPASNAYGLTHVPAIFLIEPDGAISQSWTGFSRPEFERLAARAGAPVFQASDNVPEWKAG